MRLIKRQKSTRIPTGTPPVRVPVDPLAGLLPDSGRPQPKAEPEDVRIPIPGTRGGELVIVGANPFGVPAGRKPEQLPSVEEQFSAGATALAKAFPPMEGK